MSRNYLCLDVRENEISALRIKSGFKGNEIEKGICVPADRGAGSENPWQGPAAEIADKMSPEDSVCLLSFPPSWASYRNLSLPFRDRRKITQVLGFEVEPLLPFPREEVSLDFQFIRKSEASDIIAAAVEKKRLDPLLDALAAFSMHPQIITPGGMPAALCLCRENPEKDFLYIDLDAAAFTVFACSSGSVHMVRSVYTGSASGELRKRTLKSNITRLLAAFESVHGFSPDPEAVYFSGNSLSGGEIEEAAFEIPDAAAHEVDMRRSGWLKISADYSDTEARLANNPLCLAAADWAGIDCLNFSRQKHALYRYWDEYRSDIIKSCAIGAVVLAVAMYGLFFQTSRLESRVEKLDSRITSVFRSTFPEVSRIVDPLQQMRIKVDRAKDKNSRAGLADSSPLNIDILKDLSRLTPESADVVITRFVRGGGSVLISGHTGTFNAVDDIKGALSESGLFREITISSANMDKSSGRVRFKMKLMLPEKENLSI